MSDGEKRLRHEIERCVYYDFLDGDFGASGYPVRGNRAEVGVGKTEIVIKTSASALLKLRRGGDKRVAVLAAPTHKLTEEVRQRFQAIVDRAVKKHGRRVRVKVAVWRGREADDPANPGETMCENLDNVKEAQRLLKDVEGSICVVCPFKKSCAYLGQKQDRADFWIVADQTLFNAAPEPIKRRGVAFVIVDESDSTRRSADWRWTE